MFVKFGGNSFSAAVQATQGVQITQGQKLTFDGATGAKYFSSNGATLALTGLTLDLPSLSSLTWGGTSVAGLVNGVANNAGTCIVQAGGGGTSKPIQAQIYKSVTVTNNATNVETTLDSYSMEAGTLDKLARGVRITAWGTFAANANSKTIKLKFGATDMTSGAFVGTTNSGGWKVTATVLRIGASTQTAVCDWGASVGPVNRIGLVTAPAETLSGVIVIAVTGTGVASSDITSAGMYVEFLP